jgi:hypothetical protein
MHIHPHDNNNNSTLLIVIMMSMVSMVCALSFCTMLRWVVSFCVARARSSVANTCTNHQGFTPRT